MRVLVKDLLSVLVKDFVRGHTYQHNTKGNGETVSYSHLQRADICFALRLHYER